MTVFGQAAMQGNDSSVSPCRPLSGFRGNYLPDERLLLRQHRVRRSFSGLPTAPVSCRPTYTRRTNHLPGTASAVLRDVSAAGLRGASVA